MFSYSFANLSTNNAFFSFSNALLKSIFYFGFAIALVAFIYGMNLFIGHMLGAVAPGWTSLPVEVDLRQPFAYKENIDFLMSPI